MASRQRGETMGSTESKRPSVTVEAPEKALSGLGEPITEEQAKAIAALEDCKCKEGMFALAVTRRQLLAGSGLLAALAGIKPFLTVTRTYCMECSGTTGWEIMGASEPTVQRTHGLVSTSEWTGVPLSTLLRQTGLKPGAAWVLAEGADAAVMSRSVPIDKCLSDALVVFVQNGEAIRPVRGYPTRPCL